MLAFRGNELGEEGRVVLAYVAGASATPMNVWRPGVSKKGACGRDVGYSLPPSLSSRFCISSSCRLSSSISPLEPCGFSAGFD
jgi:hypothetical protein